MIVRYRKKKLSMELELIFFITRTIVIIYAVIGIAWSSVFVHTVYKENHGDLVLAEVPLGQFLWLIALFIFSTVLWPMSLKLNWKYVMG
jgi:hypothetical protein